jgi:uncharacterized tellurite resistance protein B-like protein
MTNKSYLYDAFGELIYLVAMADGGIQQEEISALEKILNNHPWAKEISWSFNYEASKNNDPEDIYKKVIMACHDNGPDPEFTFMIEVMEAVAEASKGKDAAEEARIKGFVHDLTERFRRDIEKLYASE